MQTQVGKLHADYHSDRERWLVEMPNEHVASLFASENKVKPEDTADDNETSAFEDILVGTNNDESRMLSVGQLK